MSRCVVCSTSHKGLVFTSGGTIAWVNLNLIREFVLIAESPSLDMFSKRRSDSLNYSCFLTDDWVGEMTLGELFLN